MKPPDLPPPKFLTRIGDRFHQALQLPFSGAPHAHPSQDLRVTLYEQYAIYYLPRPDEIIIVRILHGSRDIATIADEGGFAI